MRLSCSQENLARGLSIVARAVAAKSTLPVISNILLAAEATGLKMCATNLEMAITCWVAAKVEEEGAITVPAKLLSELVSSMPNERVDLNLNAKTKALNVKCSRYDANLKGIDAEEFPPIPVVGDDSKITAAGKLLKKGIAEVAFAAASDESRPVLAGVLVRLRGSSLTLAAADGFRLSVSTVELGQAAPQEMDVIVPARALHELARVAGDDETVEISITAGRNQALFRLEKQEAGLAGVELVSRLIEGSFPNYEQIIPKSHSTRLDVATADFLKAARVASFFARDASNVVKLEFSPGQESNPGQLTVGATAAEVGDTTTVIEAIVEGESTQIAFNARYLIDLLQVVDEPRVVLDLSSPSSPGVFHLSAGLFTHVIMPMHTSGR